MRVVEVGTGPGALTLALLRAVGPTGTLVSYEVREDFAARAQDNVARFHGPAPNWRLRVADAFEGLHERDVDRIVIDLAEPWRLLDAVATALRPGGVVTGFVPTALQVKQFVDALRAHGGFAAVETLETLTRFWHVRDRSLRPEHRMVAHTGFLIFARRLAPGTSFALTPGSRSDTSNEGGHAHGSGSTQHDQGGDPREGLDDD
jgi:tRNA (adenine57-N1/adenine58-N1)-methyltransferase